MDKKEFTAFVSFDPNKPSQDAEYYFKHRNESIKPIWTSLIFGTFWFLYRRMYLAFFVMYFVVGYGLQYFFMGQGYDFGASGAYSTMIINLVTAIFGHGLFISFVTHKMEKLKHLGTHVRLFAPFAILIRNIFAILIIQIFGVWFKLDFLISWVYPFLYASFFYTIALYVYYFMDWRCRGLCKTSS
ncbi:MAG: DUF2628 domain-containing protein [Alphaproteobacteria bacterium]|nr:MAG: DUF2628 domain-containing protein [Alphaproteobacteria bacterium]